MSQRTKLLSPADLRALSQRQPWRTAFWIAADWAVIFAAIILAEWSGNWLAWLVAVPVIAGRMHGLAGLMHDFAHQRFVADRAVNDAVGDLFLAWPVGATVEGYRRNHLAHHNHTNTEQDPDWVVKLGTRHYTFPMEMRHALMNFLGYFCGVSTVRDIRMAFGRVQGDDLHGRGYKLARAGFFVAIAVALTLTGTWPQYLLYWVVPYLTFFFLFLYIRSIAEHFGPTMEPASELQGTRTVAPLFWERWFFCPHNLNYHLDHHLYPGVPCFRLPQLHAALMAKPAYAKGAHLTRGYSTGLFREVWLDSWRGRAMQPAE